MYPILLPNTFTHKKCFKSLSLPPSLADIFNVSQILACLLHFIKLCCQVYLYQLDYKTRHNKKMMHGSLWVPLEVTAPLVQSPHHKVYPLLLLNRPVQALHR